MIYYLDTSALVKRYHREKGTDVVDSIIEGSDEIYFSTLGIAETISALTRLRNSGKIGKSKYEMITGIFFRELETRFIPIPMDDSHILSSLKLIEKHDLRTLDAVHLSASMELGDIEKVCFVSADKKLLEAAEKEGMDVIDPEKDQTIKS